MSWVLHRIYFCRPISAVFTVGGNYLFGVRLGLRQKQVPIFNIWKRIIRNTCQFSVTLIQSITSWIDFYAYIITKLHNTGINSVSREYRMYITSLWYRSHTNMQPTSATYAWILLAIAASIFIAAHRFATYMRIFLATSLVGGQHGNKQ